MRLPSTEEELGKEGVAWVAGDTTWKANMGRKSSQAWVVSGRGLFELGTPLPTLGPARTPSENKER